MTKMETIVVLNTLKSTNISVKIQELDEDGDWIDLHTLEDAQSSGISGCFRVILQ